MPVPANPIASRLFRRHHFHRFHHHRRRLSLLLTFGMLSFVALCLLFANPLSAVESLSTTSRARTMMSHQELHQKGTPPGLAAAILQPLPPPGDVQREQQHQHQIQTGTQKPLLAHTQMASGTNARPPPVGATLPETLISNLPVENTLSGPFPEPLVDGHKGGRAKGKRLVFVGDVHGHLSALEALLRKVGFNHKHGDHLVFVGDIIAKGPDSAGVVKLAMELGASAVRGNHEDKVLLAHEAMQKKKNKQHKATGSGQSILPEGEVEEEKGETEGMPTSATRSKHEDHARAVARSLSAKQLKWLSSLPIILRVGHVPGAAHPPWDAGEIVVVHGGLVPAVPLGEQDPWAVMNMRTLVYPDLATTDAKEVEEGEEREEKEEGEEEDGVEPDLETTKTGTIVAVPSDTRQGEPWSHAWNRFQNTTLPTHADRTLVVYGHDAGAGLQADIEVSIRSHPAGTSSGRHEHHSSQTKNKRAQDTGIEVNIDPDVEVESSGDGDVDVEVETEIEIEIEADTEETRRRKAKGAEAEDEADIMARRGKKKKGGKKGSDKHKKKPAKKKGVRYAFGLDSGCGNGKLLSALVVGAAGPDGKVSHSIEQVECGEGGN